MKTKTLINSDKIFEEKWDKFFKKYLIVFLKICLTSFQRKFLQIYNQTVEKLAVDFKLTQIWSNYFLNNWPQKVFGFV